ncbi:MAG: polysaccharide biosynthesis tyrosine autokinase, partial [Bacteroidales bacterium]|nr:polysaccharide biosynthesis tyrosine autokinase [Bacteroidales bacterium]
MERVVQTLNADVNYLRQDGLRTIELYDNSPVRMFFSREENALPPMSIVVVPKSDSTIVAEYGGVKETFHLSDTVMIGNSPVLFQPTANYGPKWFGKSVTLNKVSLSSAASAFLSRLRVNQGNNYVLSISVQDHNLHRAKDVLECLIDKYNEVALAEKNEIAYNTADFINERILIIQDELGIVENQLADYKRREQVMSVDEQANRYLNESRSYNAEVVAVETQLSMAEYLRSFVQSSSTNNELLPLNTGLDDSRADQTIGQYNTLALRRQALVAASSEHSPAVRQVDEQLQTLRNNLLGIIDNTVSTLTIRKNDLSKQASISTQKFTAMPSKALEVLSIERQQKIKEDLYLYLLNKREENALTQAMADTNAKLVDAASGSSIPVSPSKAKMLLLAFALGLFIPAVILLFKLFLDTKIRTRKELEDSLSIPFLAEIPLKKVKGDKKKRSLETNLVYDKNSKGLYVEAMRMMCTNLDFMKPEGADHVVLAMTSLAPGAGKSFTTLNMASCLSDAKKKVVIIDADLRKRTLSGMFDLKHKVKGLSLYLYDENVTIEEIMHKEVLEGVDLIPAGHIPPNPTELLSRSRFDTLIAKLKEEYDYVILDGVPANAVADPVIMNRVVDINLLVIRSGQLDRRSLPEIEGLKENERLSNLSIILNGSEVKK